jgi:hypothetical protein
VLVSPWTVQFVERYLVLVLDVTSFTAPRLPSSRAGAEVCR